MSIQFLSGDIFLSRAQTVAHGVNCRGRMGAGIALGFRRRFPEMYQEYRRRCRRGELHPGRYFLWKESTPWVLNLATQDTTGGAQPGFVNDALIAIVERYETEGITSIAMPRIAAGLGGLPWQTVKQLLTDILEEVPIPVFVYEHFLEGVSAREVPERDSVTASHGGKAVFFWGKRHPQWHAFSNFESSPIMVAGREYATVEHYFQANKAATDWEHEMVRSAPTPREAKRLGRQVQLRTDWEQVKEEVIRIGLLAKFQQHPQLRRLLLSTGHRPIHEDSPHDAEWGWLGGSGKDRLGKLLMQVREALRQEACGEDSSGQPYSPG